MTFAQQSGCRRYRSTTVVAPLLHKMSCCDDFVTQKAADYIRHMRNGGWVWDVDWT